MTVRWVEVQSQLQDEGNDAFLCDIVVPDADAGDWQRVLDLLNDRRDDWQVTYSEDGVPVDLPRHAMELIRRSAEAGVKISTSVAGLPIFGHVFAQNWIEFDVPSRDIDGQEQLDALVSFVEELGRALGKQVRATPEAAYDAPIFLYEPGADAVRPA